MRFFLSLFLLLILFSVTGQTIPTVYPTPQEIDFNGSFMKSSQAKTKWSISKSVDKQLASQIRLLMDGFDVKVVAGIASDRGMSKYSKVPTQAEAYSLIINPQSIVVIGRDDAGLYYAIQTLKQLIINDGSIRKLPIGTINDWPDVSFRGTVEGFYGKPWEHSDRLSQLEFYGKYKLNTYIYGPKDDPYHGFSNQWREPYPVDKATHIKELVKKARQNRVNFIWAVHPGRDISWDDKDGDGIADDFAACVKKFEMMYQLGVRSFAVFFDDIGGEGAKAPKQAEMLNYLNSQFVRKKKDVTPLIMCPTQYNKAWSGGDYLDVLGNNLDHDIAIMWTGNSVCADITREGMDWINNRIKRSAFVWWNWPVSDYVRTRLLIGRTYGLDADNKGTMWGFTANPMDKPEASKIGLFGVADYTWNMSAFNSHTSWTDGIDRLFPSLAPELKVFASHNSDQGVNTHGYRREESVDVAPFMSKAMKELNADGKLSSKVHDAVSGAFVEMIGAASTLNEKLPSEYPALNEEIECWVASFEQLAHAGKKMMSLLGVNQSVDVQVDGLNEVLRYFEEIENQSRKQKQKGAPDIWAQGCVAAGSVVTPFVNQLFDYQSKTTYCAITGKDLSPAVDHSKHYNIITNVKSLEGAQVERKSKYVTISPILEVVSLQPGDYFGISLPMGVYADYVHARLDNKSAAVGGRIEVSKDGVTWEAIDAGSEGSELQCRLNPKDLLMYARFINHSSALLDVKIELFKLDVPIDARINSREALSDGDFRSFWLLQASKDITVIEAPHTKSSSVVYVIGDVHAVTVVYADGTSTPYHEQNEGNVIRELHIDTSLAPASIHEVMWK